MHIDPSSSSSASDSSLQDPRPWYKLLTRYHWFVLTVAALGWLFDCLDQQLFVLARPAAMEELVKETPELTGKALDAARSRAGDYATSIFILGWATGGLFFGMMGDRIGRAKTMVITILMYSIFTGFSSFSVGVWDFALYRFLTGLGVGGEFAVGVSLVAEVMPTKARPYALGLLQALSAIGNLSAAFINLSLGLAEEQGLEWSPWRIMFLIGAVPALLALVVRRNLKEPETWSKAAQTDVTKKQLGSYADLFRDPKLRKHALLGLVLGCAGVIGLWSIGFYSPDLARRIQRPVVTQEVFEERLAQARASNDKAVEDRILAIQAFLQNPDAETKFDTETHAEQASIEKTIKGRLAHWGSYASIAMNIGAFFGMFGFGALSQRIGRRPTFAIALIAAFLSTFSVFCFMKELWQIFVLVPIMGFCQLSLFAGYAIYFPELFPTRLRSTGTSFCYNVGRFVAAAGPLAKMTLDSQFASAPDPLRQSGMTMSCIFLIGLLVLPFLPETRNKALPE